MSKSKNKRTAFKQIISRIFTKGFRETFSLDSLSKLTRVLKSNNMDCILCHGSLNDKIIKINNYVRKVPHDEFLVSKEALRSNDKDLVSSQHVLENDIYFIPYKVYILDIMSSSLNKLKGSENFEMSPTTVLRCQIANSLVSKTYNYLSSHADRYDFFSNNLFFQKIKIRSDDISSSIPSLISSLYYLDPKFAKESFPDYELLFESRKNDFNLIFGIWDADKKISSKGLNSLEILKMIKELSSKSIIMCTKGKEVDVEIQLARSLERNVVYKFDTLNSSSFSLVKNFFQNESGYSSSDIISISKSYGVLSRLYPHKIPSLISLIDDRKVPEFNSDFINTSGSKSDCFSYLYFYSVIKPVPNISSSLQMFCKKHLALNYYSISRPNIEDGQRVGTLSEVYNSQGKNMTFNLTFGRKGGNLFWVNLNNSHSIKEFKDCLKIFCIRNSVSITWDSKTTFVRDDISRKVILSKENTQNIDGVTWSLQDKNDILESGTRNAWFLKYMDKATYSNFKKVKYSNLRMTHDTYSLVSGDINIYSPSLKFSDLSDIIRGKKTLSDFNTIFGTNLFSRGKDLPENIVSELGDHLAPFIKMCKSSIQERFRVEDIPDKGNKLGIQSLKYKHGDKEYCNKELIQQSPIFDEIKSLLMMDSHILNRLEMVSTVIYEEENNPVNLLIREVSKHKFEDKSYVSKEEFLKEQLFISQKCILISGLSLEKVIKAQADRMFK